MGLKVGQMKNHTIVTNQDNIRFLLCQVNKRGHFQLGRMDGATGVEGEDYTKCSALLTSPCNAHLGRQRNPNTKLVPCSKIQKLSHVCQSVHTSIVRDSKRERSLVLKCWMVLDFRDINTRFCGC